MRHLLPIQNTPTSSFNSFGVHLVKFFYLDDKERCECSFRFNYLGASLEGSTAKTFTHVKCLLYVQSLTRLVEPVGEKGLWPSR